jgi:hypothetical protein
MPKGELNGETKRVDKRKPHIFRHWFNYCCLSGIPLVLVGCSSLKKAGLIGGASLLGGATASIVSSGTAPVLLAGAASASVTSVIVDQTRSSQTTEGVSSTLNNCAPDNFWTLLGDLVSMGGWLLILVILVPMVLGWILPGPLERKKKS